MPQGAAPNFAPSYCGMFSTPKLQLSTGFWRSWWTWQIQVCLDANKLQKGLTCPLHFALADQDRCCTWEIQWLQWASGQTLNKRRQQFKNLKVWNGLHDPCSESHCADSKNKTTWPSSKILPQSVFVCVWWKLLCPFRSQAALPWQNIQDKQILAYLHTKFLLDASL